MLGIKHIILVLFVSWLSYHIAGLLFTDEYNDVSQALSDKNILITGASSGIGEQMAYQYARLGANVFITARREQLLMKVIEKCKSMGISARKYGYMPGDMGNVDDRNRLIKAAQDFFGDIDQLILNHVRQPIIERWTGSKEQLEEFNTMVNVNVVSYVHLASAALPSLRRTAGSIGVVGSMAGRMPTPFTLDYSTTKFALDGFFSGLRYELSALKENVSITHSVIGFVDTKAGARSLEKVKSLMASPNNFLMDLFTPATPDTAAYAIVHATTQRRGELYFPTYHMLWFLSVLRSISPELEKLDFIGFGQK